MQIKYEAPAHHALEAEGQTVQGGETFEVSDAAGKRLLSDPHVHVSTVEPPKQPAAENKKPEAKSAGRKSTEKEA